MRVSGDSHAQEFLRMFLPPSCRALSQFSQRHQKPGYCSPADVPRNTIFMGGSLSYVQNGTGRYYITLD